MSAMKDPEIAEAAKLLDKASKKLDEDGFQGFRCAAELVRKAQDVLSYDGKILLLKMGDNEIGDTLGQIEEACRRCGWIDGPGWRNVPGRVFCHPATPNEVSTKLSEVANRLREINKPQQKPKRKQPGKKQ